MNMKDSLEILKSVCPRRSVCNFTVWDSVFGKFLKYPDEEKATYFPVCVRQSEFSHMIIFIHENDNLLLYDPAQIDLKNYRPSYDGLFKFFEKFTRCSKITCVKFTGQQKDKYDCVDLCLKFIVYLNKNGIR